MRDETSQSSKNSSKAAEHSHGSSPPRKDASMSSFTAVNGASSSSSRPATAQDGDSISVLPRPTSTGPHSATVPRSYGWRHDDRHIVDASQPQQSIESLKRKRVDGPSDEATNDEARHRSAVSAEYGSPKRRATAPDSAVETETPERQRSYPPVRDHPAGRSSREPSPVPMNKAPPLPTVRPETERDMAASVQRELQNSPGHSQAGAESTHSDSMSYTHAHPHHNNGPQSYSPEQSHAAHLDDAKKRKRQFSNRTKTGCHTCRARKKKCDERKPTCHNCERGGFQCGGYGAKPPGFKVPSSAQKQPVHLQSKPPIEQQHSHGPHPGYHFMPPQVGEGPRYDHWGRVPSQHESAAPQVQDLRHGHYPDPASNWHRHSHSGQWQHPRAPEPPGYPSSHRPLHPPHHAPPPPLIPPDRPPHDVGPGSHIPPYNQPPPALPPPPQFGPDGTYSIRTDVVGPVRRHTGTYSVTSSGSGHGGYSSRSAGNHAFHERYNMLIGQPFGPYVNNTLLADRQACQSALERYNDAADSRSGISSEERGRFFRAIVEPGQRSEFTKSRDTYNGPVGKVGPNTIVETPFHCDYGYNIHLGEGIVIQSGCRMQDACEIRIGDRTIIGPNVKFYGVTASVDHTKRKGTQGMFVAGAIFVGDDCFIGGDVIILPYRKIGRGAVVGAGSVVTKDVPDFTVVAGNPAKIIRRIEPGGASIPEHASHDIHQQNERMIRDMRDSVQRQIEANR